MPYTPASIQRTQLEAIKRITAVQDRVRDAVVALRDQQPGYPTSTAGGGSSPTLDAAGNPPGLDRYLTGRDQAAQDLHTLTRTTEQLLTISTVIYDLVSRWTQDASFEVDQPRRAASGGDCVCCGRYCSGADTDRLRAGLCMACYQDRRRSSLERGDWMIERRRNLQAEQEDAA